MQHQDIQSHNRVLDALTDKVKVIGQISSDAPALRTLNNLIEKFKGVCSRSEEAITSTKQSVADHQRYEELCQQLNDKLSQASNKVETAAVASGDRFTLQGKLEVLQVSDNVIMTNSKTLYN